MRDIMRAGEKKRAAIASKRAAELYGAAILREHLEDDRENYTRFFLLAAAAEPPIHFAGGLAADKISLVFQLAHIPGALLHALEPFARRNINVMKIESRPMHGRPWQYRFYLDLQAAASDPEIIAALGELEKVVVELKVLGSYKSASYVATSQQSPPRDLAETARINATLHEGSQ